MKTLTYTPSVRIAQKTLAYILVFCIVNMPVWALNWNGVGTNASFNGIDTVNVTNLRSYIEWNNFDTDPGQLLQFLAGGPLSADYAVLNKVVGADPTLFQGILQAGQGHIILMNPNGITIGSTASINAGKFTASTMDMMNVEDFLADSGISAENYQFEFAKTSGTPAAIINNADIIYNGVTGEGVAEQINFLGDTVLNTGTITTGAKGVVAMAAGESILLGEPGSNVIVQMNSIDGGMVTNSGVVNAPEGTIVMAAGDIYATPTMGMKVFDGSGTVTQDGTLSVDAVADDGNGGTIHILAGENVTLTENSVTTADASPVVIDEPPSGGRIIIESTENVNIDSGASLSAKGHGWDDVDENFRFDFGIDTSYSGSVKIAGKYLNLADPEEFASQIDTIGYVGGQVQSGTITIGNNAGDMIVAEGPMPGLSAANTVYEEWIEGMSLGGVHIDTLSAGNITFDDMNPGDTKDLGLIGGAGNVSFRTQFESGGISMTDTTDIIGTLDGGDIFMVAGSGGITTGSIGIINEDGTGDPGQIILATANGGDIQTGRMGVRSGNHEIVSISSSGDVTIDGGLIVYAQEVSDSEDKTVTADICIDAGDDITINGPVEAEAHGKVEMITNIHLDAGIDPDSNDDGEDQAGIITIDLDGGQISARAEASGPDPEGTNDLYSEATIEIHTSATGEDAITITNGKAGGSQAVQARANVQGGLGFDEAMPAEDPTYHFESDSDFDNKGNQRTATIMIEIQSGYDVTECEDCVKPPFLPPTPKYFFVKNDDKTIDWRSGYTIDSFFFDPYTLEQQDGTGGVLDVLLNDNGGGIPLFEADLIAPDGGTFVLTTDKGGTLELVQFEYTDGDGITHFYDALLYTPPSYTEDFEWDGVSDYATFTDSFQYRAQIGDDISLNIATVTLTVQNEVPTLAGDSDTIHMNTSKDFDLSTLVTDSDGTPGELTGDFTGTYGSLNYQIVEGLIPVSNGDIATDSGLIPDTLTLSGDTITYAPLDGYVSPNGAATTFGYTVTDDNISNATFGLPDGEDLSVVVTNTLPSGAVTLNDAHMDANGQVVSVVSGDFSDAEDSFAIASIDPATDDNNKTFGGSLDYNGQDDPYVSGDDYTYTADAALPGYVGEDDFVASLWDGQKTYYTDGTSENVYGTGTIDLTVTNDTPDGAIVLDNAQMNADGQDLGVISGDFTDTNSDAFAIVSIDPATDDYNVTYGGSLSYNGTTDPYAAGDDYSYTADPALPGYVGEDDFVATLWDGQKDYAFVEVGGVWTIDTQNTTNVYGTGTIDVDVVNDRPEGDSWLGTTTMDTALTNASLATDGFTDNNGDSITVMIEGVSSDDYNGSFGGSLTYDGTDYDYDPAAMGLPGYVGDDEDSFDYGGDIAAHADDRFDVKLWDGEILYTFDEQGNITSQTNQYGDGTISVDITNELPEGDAGFGVIHMDSQDVTQSLDYDFADGIVIQPGTYTDGSVIDNYGNRTDSYSGTLTYNGDGTWTYSAPESDLPGFVGDDTDNYADYGETDQGILDHADNLFVINLTNGEYDYWFSEDPAPSDYEPFEYADGQFIYRKANFSEGTGTVSVDITNELPTIDADDVTEHMNEDILNQLLASDTLDPNPNNGLDDLTVTGPIYSDFGMIVSVTQNPDGSLSYSYTPADGYVGEDGFDISVWDGQRDYVFNDGEIAGNDPVTVDGTVSLEYTNILPGGAGDLGSTTSGTTLTVSQPIPDTTSPVLVIDFPDLPQQDIDDTLSIPTGTYTGSAGGTLVYNGTNWTYTPPAGFTGTETFEINVWDGQKEYADQYYGGEGYLGNVYGQATVSVTVTSTPPPPPPTPEPVAPVAPLAQYELPKLVGCPAEMEAAANELAINTGELQLVIANAMATNPNLQPCDACQLLLTSATMLQDSNGAGRDALQQIFNQPSVASALTGASLDQPFTPDQIAGVQMAIADVVRDNPQLAAGIDYADAFVNYIAVISEELKVPVADPVDLLMEKHGDALVDSENPEITAYLTSLLASEGTL